MDVGHEASIEVLRIKSLYHPANVYRRGELVLRDSRPWSGTINSLLRHLEAVGFAGAPRVAGTGFDPDGRQTLSYIEGEILNEEPAWSLQAAHAVGELLRQLHDATASFRPPQDAEWCPLYSRELGGEPRVIGHCDLGPWNIVARGGLPVCLIDWERAGPIDPLVELAEACWLNARLHNDQIAESEHLLPLSDRAVQMRTIVDGYGLTAIQRQGFVERMIEVAVHCTAAEAGDAGVTRDTTTDLAPELVWALSWRARDAAWLMRHRLQLQDVLA